MKDTRNRFFFGVFVGFIVAGFFFFFFYRGVSAQQRPSEPLPQPSAAASRPPVTPNYYVIPVNAPHRIPGATPRNPARVIVDPQKYPEAAPAQDVQLQPDELAASYGVPPANGSVPAPSNHPKAPLAEVPPSVYCDPRPADRPV